MELYKCEHCGRLYDKPATIDYEDGTVYICPLCGERTQGITVEIEVRSGENEKHPDNRDPV